jgi:hypothetical protein
VLTSESVETPAGSFCEICLDDGALVPAGYQVEWEGHTAALCDGCAAAWWSAIDTPYLIRMIPHRPANQPVAHGLR